ncbi:MAG: hypothetical protein WBN22_08335 [Verrucomicrobiia bacterium]
MRQLIKSFLWIGSLALGLQSAWAFSLLGPEANGGDAWQINANGYNPLANGDVPPYFLDPLGPGYEGSKGIGPKNLGEGYRRNTPWMYYTFDASFGDYFGSNGEVAVEQAFGILNNLTNVDSYSQDLSVFPLNSVSLNYQAQALGLIDLKSVTLSLLVEQLGLADAIRYTWALHDRRTLAGCTGSCPLCLEYLVIMRNFDFFPTPLDQSQYSAYVNNELYNYTIYEDCNGPGSPPTADAFEIPTDPINNNPPVASGNGEADLFDLLGGYFFTGLTRDDVAGLRWLYSTNNYDTPSVQYVESPAAGSTVISGGGGLTFTNLNAPFQLTTSNLTALVLASATNNPAALQTLYPGLVISSVITNYNGTFTYTFANVETNSFSTNTTVQYQIQTITITPPFVFGNPPTTTTNTSSYTTQSNLVSGDFFLIPSNTCGLDVLQVLATNVTAITNTPATVTNIAGSTTNYITTKLVFLSTNYTLLVAACEFLNNNGGTNSNAGDYQGIGRMQFVRVSDDNYDYQTGQFIQPITNQYTMVVNINYQAVAQTFQRVVTTPDFVFSAKDMASGPNSGDWVQPFDRIVTFDSSNAPPSLAGPGTISAGVSNVISFDKVGPVFNNESPSFLNGPGGANYPYLVWGSFDGTTNAPVVYPNGTSIANLAAEALIQISPPSSNLLVYTNSVGFVSTNIFSATGGTSPYTWTLAPTSAGLPPGLNLSPGGVISGAPAQSGTFDGIVIQMTDSSYPANVVDTTYSLTIN